MALSDVLFVAVTCTRDEGRERALKRLVRSLNREHRRTGLLRNLLVFDNGSTFMEPLEAITTGGWLVRSGTNVGYWSALEWCMRNAEEVCGRSFEYVHPVESDLVFYGLHRLNEAVRFLDQHSAVESVRTQEFSVARRNFYFKNGRSLLRSRRSRVADYHGVTGEKVAFERMAGFPSIHLATWHAKVPALHRMTMLKAVFAKLACSKEVTEHEFMKVAHARAPRVGVLDKGIYYTQSFAPSSRFITGSWSSQQALEKVGYRGTRVDRFQQVDAVQVRSL